MKTISAADLTNITGGSSPVVAGNGGFGSFGGLAGGGIGAGAGCGGNGQLFGAMHGIEHSLNSLNNNNNNNGGLFGGDNGMMMMMAMGMAMNRQPSTVVYNYSSGGGYCHRHCW